MNELWYAQPARKWVEALPLGNGRVGAMAFSGTQEERLCLNEDTLWSGGPWRYDAPRREHWERARALVRAGDYAAAQAELEERMQFPYTEAYEPFGELRVRFETAADTPAADYRRGLDLDAAAVKASYKLGENRVRSSCFVSRADELLVLRIEADAPLSAVFSLSSPLRSEAFETDGCAGLRVRAPSSCAPNYLGDIPEPIRYEEGERQGLEGVCLMEVRCDGAQDVRAGMLHVHGARTMEARLSLRTNYLDFRTPPAGSPVDALALARADLDTAAGKDYDALFERHLAEYRPYFRRVSLALGDAEGTDALATDERLRMSPADCADPRLVELAFAYGRYLLIASSRPGTQAANLQGIWNADVRPPWSCNYTVNINTQMNYWPAEPCGLPEMHGPLLDLIDRLRVTGAQTARITYGAPGAVCHHNTDLWAHTNAVGADRRGSAMWSQWPMGYAWLTRHMMERWRYGRDRAFLRERALPALRDACAFFTEMMAQDEAGQWVFSPATSPENVFFYRDGQSAVAKRSTMTDAIVREAFENYLEALETLGLDEPLGARVREMRSRMPLPGVGADGRLLEWDQDYTEVEPQHRHVSHLYGLYPADLIAPDSALADACRRSLIARGDVGTGWSLGWKICLWARLGDGAHALRLLSMQLTPHDEAHPGGRTYPNLFDAHPPFQIDGNFAAAAGVAQMLLACGKDTVRLLPALPPAWPCGRVRGLRAAGGYEVSLSWHDGRLERAKLTAVVPEPARITLRYGEGERTLALPCGETRTLAAHDFC